MGVKAPSFSRCTCTITPYFSSPFCHTLTDDMLHCKTSSKGVIINCKFDGSTLAWKNPSTTVTTVACVLFTFSNTAAQEQDYRTLAHQEEDFHEILL
jgi:hypothetical protein